MTSLALTARLFDYWVTVYQRTWRGSVINSFLTPLLYVVAMGVLLGGFIKADPARLDGAHSYLQFVVPGLLAGQSMHLAFGETTYPVMGAVKWNKTYFGMLATPLRVADIALAHLSFTVARIASSTAVFVIVMAAFGAWSSVAGAVVVFLLQLLIGLAFAAPIYAYAATLKDEGGFTVVFRLLMMPLFLFSGAFFPLGNLPPVLEWIARLTPLWQGVDLTRMAALGTWSWPAALVHLAYLAVVAGGGTWLAVRALERRLVR